MLPILHLNGFKIANPTISATMSEEDLKSVYTGLGYDVRFVREGPTIEADCAAALEWAHGEIHGVQDRARAGAPDERPRWPMIVLVTPKGLGCPETLDGKKLEGSFRSHQVPIPSPPSRTLPAKWLAGGEGLDLRLLSRSS